MRVGFIGLGRMGSGMAASLVRAGHEVYVYNRTPGKTDALSALGAQVASSLEEVSQVEVAFTMLPNDAAVEEVVLGEGGIAEHLPEGAVHVSSSTISVSFSGRLAEQHSIRGQEYVAAPVFGRPDAAAAAKLFVVASGRPDTVERVLPLLNAVGQGTYKVSEDPKTANLVKLSGNFLVASVIESLGEVLAVAEKGGVDRHQCLEILTSTLFNAPVYKTYGGLIADRKFEPGFGAPLAQKDIRLLLAAAEALNVSLPFASVLRDRLVNLLAHGGDKLDWSAIGGMAARDAGLLRELG
ncbi:NAD(P)-dependent oxidoreductase [Rhizobium leguminosarum]|uniref:NAD(P)-dependent oxidoreductase n=1 Tax=Rhizobium leguminosarum TaxID=384 RepID=UPI001C949DC9|nr:NAD(P)-dependent oxidoreductase [Rhizobium leguminosarum]MBY5533694.1 NAD(P)-dependent oxidoreductase [Rhizobium leguminosarum]